MMWNVVRRVFFVAAAMAVPGVGWGQEKSKPQGDDAKLVIKVYRVLDLVTTATNYPYETTYIPGTARPTAGGSGTITGGMGGMGAGMGTGGGMGGTGMGGGMFQVPDNLAQTAPSRRGAGVGGAIASGPPAAPRRSGPLRIEMSQLIEAVTTIVEPETWDEVGGEGAIQPVGGALVVRQTLAIQSKVQEFLEALRRESGSLRRLVVKARWLMLDDGQLTALTSNAEQDMQSGSETVDRNALKALPAETQRFAGQIACFNGQTVHIISGRLESVVQSFIPVVGGAEVGYQPIILTPHVGALLQVTPSMLPEGEMVLLDLHSCVTRWDSPDSPDQLQSLDNQSKTSKVAQYPARMDRLRLAAQQFATSTRVPLNQPVLIGGLTFPAKQPTEIDGQLYLIVEVREN
jgi:hypothetical protein